jgi:hypothetical protein
LRASLIAGLAAAAVLAACGGSSRTSASQTTPQTVSKAAYLSAADAVCSHYQGSIDGLVKTIEASSGSPKRFKATEGFLEGALQFLRSEEASIAALPRPRGANLQLATMLDSLRQALAILAGSSAAISHRDVLAFKASATQAQALSARARADAAAYGFKDCLRMF